MIVCEVSWKCEGHEQGPMVPCLRPAEFLAEAIGDQRHDRYKVCAVHAVKARSMDGLWTARPLLDTDVSSIEEWRKKIEDWSIASQGLSEHGSGSD